MDKKCEQLITMPTNVKVDDWQAVGEAEIFKSVDKAIILPLRKIGGDEINDKQDFDYFCLTPKRCYAKDDVRTHICHYLNYFEAFFDPDLELITEYWYIKYSIDFIKEYSKEQFIDDVKRRIIFNQSILEKVGAMNRYNYMVQLEPKKGKSIQSLQYNTSHGMILMYMSLLMDMCIPLICHYAYIHPVAIDDFILEVFDIILFHPMFPVDIYSKFYETATTEINKSETVHAGLWAIQGIRGKDTVTHAQDSITNIILNIMPKYIYEQNVVSFNFSSIRNNTGFKVLDIKYEYNYTMLSSSNRDEDNNSEFDKYEAALVQQDEALYLQNKYNCEQTLKTIFNKFGPYDKDEIEFYRKHLTYENGTVYHPWQKEKIFNLFYKYFGDPRSIKSINQDDYLMLILTAKRLLESNSMVLLPYIFSGRVIKVPHKKSINKKQLFAIEEDPLWGMICEMYNHNQKILEEIKSQIGIAVSSEFQIVNYDSEELHGKMISIIPEILISEYLMFVLMIS